MKLFRRATLIILCMGLALPSAPALALCMDSEGNVPVVVLEIDFGSAAIVLE